MAVSDERGTPEPERRPYRHPVLPYASVIQSRRVFLRNTVLVYLKDRNKTIVYLNFTYILKIDKIYAKMSSDRIPQEYSSG